MGAVSNHEGCGHPSRHDEDAAPQDEGRNVLQEPGISIRASEEQPMIKRITSKGRTTIPKSVRMALHLRDSDHVAYTIRTDNVALTRSPRRRSQEDPFCVFSEWSSDADCKSYGNL